MKDLESGRELEQVCKNTRVEDKSNKMKAEPTESNFNLMHNLFVKTSQSGASLNAMHEELSI